MSRQARVGLLVLAGILLFLVAIFAIANRSFLFSNTFTINARYDQVAGLQAGAPVQFQGVNVGRVRTVRLPNTPNGQIVVEMAVQENVRPLINTSTQAQIKSEGLVGNQMVVLVNPPELQTVEEPIEEGEFITGVDPFDLYEIADRAFASVQTFEDVAEEAQQIMRDIQGGEGTLGRLIYDPSLYNEFVASTEEAQRVLRGVSEDTDALVQVAERATEGVNSILLKVNEGEGSLARMLNDPTVYNSMLATSDTLLNIAGDMRSILQNTENATSWASLGSYRFAELMEAAKHNWLFRRYFEDRGYMEKAPFEVREQAIEESYRQLEARQRELERQIERYQTLIEEIEENGRPVSPVPDSLEAEDAAASDETVPASGDSE